MKEKPYRAAIEIKFKLSLFLVFDNALALRKMRAEKNSDIIEIENYIFEFIKNSEKVLASGGHSEIFGYKKTLREIYREFSLYNQIAAAIVSAIDLRERRFAPESFSDYPDFPDFPDSLIAQDLLTLVNEADFPTKIMPPKIEAASAALSKLPFAMEPGEYANYVAHSIYILEGALGAPLSESFKNILNPMAQNAFGARFSRLALVLARALSFEALSLKELRELKKTLKSFPGIYSNIDFLNILLECLNYIYAQFSYVKKGNFEMLYNDSFTHKDVYFTFKEYFGDAENDVLLEEAKERLTEICENYIDEMNAIVKNIESVNNIEQDPVFINLTKLFSESFNEDYYFEPCEKYLAEFTPKELEEFKLYFEKSLEKMEPVLKNFGLASLYCVFTENEFSDYILKSLNKFENKKDKILAYNYIYYNLE